MSSFEKHPSEQLLYIQPSTLGNEILKRTYNEITD